MGHVERVRLKILGRARLIPPDDPPVVRRLAVPGNPATIERGMVIAIEAFDRNCRQHLTPAVSDRGVASRGERQRRPEGARRAS